MNILLGITGGISIYKMPTAIGLMKRSGHQVRVVMTKHATKFVAPLTFQAISEGPVFVEMFDPPKVFNIEHIDLAKEADLVLIAPATANVIGKIANGIADDLLTTIVCATSIDKPVVFAPAMNTAMWDNPLVQQNIAKLQEIFMQRNSSLPKYRFLEPIEKWLACGDLAKGALVEPTTIHQAVEELLQEYYSDRYPPKK
jgi:phosphopantothenoylcysteine decarboxylase/phosphopantothenate--cysteine ligase